VFEEFAAIANLPSDATLRAVVDAVQAIPYGRPPTRAPEGVIQSWRGTCSTKHALLMAIVRERWPDMCPRLVHRVYRADTASVRGRYGTAVAGAVPEEGLTDVHRYLMITISGKDVVIDVTFPNESQWDGQSSMPLGCGIGEDFASGDDPDADKASLEAQHCDPKIREPFIAALAAMSKAATLGRLKNAAR
jgi:hypothetical protein